MVRSCYRAYMRTIVGQDAQEVVWFFVPPGTPTLGFPSVYGSRNWEDLPDKENHGCGEQRPDYLCSCAYGAPCAAHWPAGCTRPDECYHPLWYNGRAPAPYTFLTHGRKQVDSAMMHNIGSTSSINFVMFGQGLPNVGIPYFDSFIPFKTAAQVAESVAARINGYPPMAAIVTAEAIGPVLYLQHVQAAPTDTSFVVAFSQPGSFGQSITFATQLVSPGAPTGTGPPPCGDGDWLACADPAKGDRIFQTNAIGQCEECSTPFVSATAVEQEAGTAPISFGPVGVPATAVEHEAGTAPISFGPVVMAIAVEHEAGTAPTSGAASGPTVAGFSTASSSSSSVTISKPSTYRTGDGLLACGYGNVTSGGLTFSQTGTFTSKAQPGAGATIAVVAALGRIGGGSEPATYTGTWSAPGSSQTGEILLDIPGAGALSGWNVEETQQAIGSAAWGSFTLTLSSTGLLVAIIGWERTGTQIISPPAGGVWTLVDTLIVHSSGTTVYALSVYTAPVTVTGPFVTGQWTWSGSVDSSGIILLIPG